MSEIYYPKCYALVSGGKDSLTTAQMLDEAGKLQGCVALRTNLATPDWQPFVEKTCAERGWSLEVFETPASYDDLVLKFGFPGPSKHKWFMDYLKGRCIRQFKKAHPDGILASGVRVGESARRAIHTSPISFWEGVPILAPIYHLATDAVWSYFHSRGFERAPGYSTLQISGDCLCGAFAKEEEKAAVEFHYPKMGEHFAALGRAIKDKFPKRSEWGWGWRQKVKKPKNVSAICVECGDADPVDPFS
jgi:3'-phosphoadenosine 5'-phosphosulfate sulfotransferase (PAPS reductase)/FAD synthetase